MHIRIPKASKGKFIGFLILSLTLHLAVCKLPVKSSVVNRDETRTIEVSILSVASPITNTNSEHDEKADDKKTNIKQKPQPNSNSGHSANAHSQKIKSVNTSNDKGADSVTVVKTLSESEYIQTVAPEYPKKAIDKGQQGTVIVKALIGFDGQAKLVDVSDSSGHAILDNSAIKAVSKWEFMPNDKDDAEMWVQVPVKFIIK